MENRTFVLFHVSKPIKIIVSAWTRTQIIWPFSWNDLIYQIIHIFTIVEFNIGQQMVLILIYWLILHFTGVQRAYVSLVPVLFFAFEEDDLKFIQFG